MAERPSFRADMERRASVREALRAERAAERGVVFVRDISVSYALFSIPCFVLCSPLLSYFEDLECVIYVIIYVFIFPLLISRAFKCGYCVYLYV